jgi:Uma2 family endonuclease
MEAGIEVAREPKPRAFIADLAVTCEPVDENRPTMAEPRLVIEVVSTSTDKIDKTEKLQAYMTLPSVEEVWLVWSTNRLVLQAVRATEGWGGPRAFIGEASFRSPVLGVSAALADIYRFTPLGRTEPESDVEPADPVD